MPRENAPIRSPEDLREACAGKLREVRVRCSFLGHLSQVDLAQHESRMRGY